MCFRYYRNLSFSFSSHQLAMSFWSIPSNIGLIFTMTVWYYMMYYSLKGSRYDMNLLSIDDKVTETACPEASQSRAWWNRFIALPLSLLSSPSKVSRNDDAPPTLSHMKKCLIDSAHSKSRCYFSASIQAKNMRDAYLKIYVFLWLFRCLCWRSDRVAVCVHLLSPALPTLSAHGLPPALRQPGRCRPRALAPPGRPAAHRQCHHPPPGGFDWRAGMTSGHHRDSPQHPYKATKPTPPFPVTDWHLYTFQWTVIHLTSLLTVKSLSRWHLHFFVFIFFFYIWFLLSSRESLYLDVIYERDQEIWDIAAEREEREKHVENLRKQVLLMGVKEDEKVCSFCWNFFA